jgi:hypothetical protein
MYTLVSMSNRTAVVCLVFTDMMNIVLSGKGVELISEMETDPVITV